MTSTLDLNTLSEPLRAAFQGVLGELEEVRKLYGENKQLQTETLKLRQDAEAERDRLAVEVRLLKEAIRLLRLKKYGAKSEQLTDGQLALLELEPGVLREEVAAGMGMDERIGRRFLNAGIGFGGSCFPKDLSAFIKIAEQIGYDFRLLKEVQRINAEQMERFVKKILDTLWVLKDKKIGVLGLAFKQNTDDVRSSPAIDLCQRLLKEGATLRVYDPKAMEKARAILPDVTYVDDMNAVAEGCDALVVATEWDEFKQLDAQRARQALTHPILFDGRNLFDAQEMEAAGWIYKSVGR